MSARDEILSRIRSALGPDTPHAPAEIPRAYRLTTTDNLDTFLDRLAHYEATTHVVDEAEVGGVVSAKLQGRRMVAPPGLPGEWLAGIDVLTDDPPLDHDALDQADGVITTCALAIAQTGTIILDGGPGMGRRALTLLPDYHLCIVRTSQLVSSVPEAIRTLEQNPAHDPTRPLTFVSGPSATVDIEMTRVRGVHGPRRLEVLVATAATAPPNSEAT